MPSTQLLDSAKEFLTESLRNYSARKLNFAIVHAVTATELILKERLFRKNHRLIFRNIQKFSTISLSQIPQRLEEQGMPLDPISEALVTDFRKWRNEIVHCMPTFNSAVAENRVPKLLDFLADQLRTELHTPLEDFLPRDLYREAKNLLRDWKRAIKSARIRAAASGYSRVKEECPECGVQKVLCLLDESKLHCYLCDAKLFVLDRCDGCGDETIVRYQPFPFDNYCDGCVSDAGDQYLESLRTRFAESESDHSG